MHCIGTCPYCFKRGMCPSSSSYTFKATNLSAVHRQTQPWFEQLYTCPTSAQGRGHWPQSNERTLLWTEQTSFQSSNEQKYFGRLVQTVPSPKPFGFPQDCSELQEHVLLRGPWFASSRVHQCAGSRQFPPAEASWWHLSSAKGAPRGCGKPSSPAHQPQHTCKP